MHVRRRIHLVWGIDERLRICILALFLASWAGLGAPPERACEGCRGEGEGSPRLANCAAGVGHDVQSAIFWEIAWRARDAVPDNSAALFASLIICSLLYFATVLVLPSDTVQRRDLDEHFFLEKGKVLGCLLLANTLAYGSRYALMGWQSFAYFSWADWVELSLFLAGCAAGIFVNARRSIIAILALLLFLNLIDPVSTLLES